MKRAARSVISSCNGRRPGSLPHRASRDAMRARTADTAQFRTLRKLEAGAGVDILRDALGWRRKAWQGAGHHVVIVVAVPGEGPDRLAEIRGHRSEAIAVGRGDDLRRRIREKATARLGDHC